MKLSFLISFVQTKKINLTIICSSTHYSHTQRNPKVSYLNFTQRKEILTGPNKPNKDVLGCVVHNFRTSSFKEFAVTEFDEGL